MEPAVSRTRLYSRIHDVVVDVETGEGGTLVVEIRADVAVARIIIPRRDLKSLLRLSHHLYVHDQVFHDLIAHHLHPKRSGR